MKILRVLLVCVFLKPGLIFSQEIKRVKIGELQKIIAETKTPLIVSFWATWCKPCLEELPYFLEEYNGHKDSLQLFLVNMDFREEYPGRVATFAEKRKIKAPIFWLDETNADLFCPKIDSSWSGAIPASVFINAKTGYRSFFEEQISHEQLKKEIMAILE